MLNTILEIQLDFTAEGFKGTLLNLVANLTVKI